MEVLSKTKGQFCEFLGITNKTYNAYIKGRDIPSSVLEKMSDLTGCFVDYLPGIDSKKNSA